MSLEKWIRAFTSDVRPEDATLGPMFVLMVIGGVGGAISYISMAACLDLLVADEDSMTTLSYGQQAGLFSMPTCMFLGTASGIACYFARMRQWTLSVGIVFSSGLLAFRLTWGLWCDQRQTHGYDRSELFLYYPPIILCLVMAVMLLLLFAVQGFLIVVARRTE